MRSKKPPPIAKAQDYFATSAGAHICKNTKAPKICGQSECKICGQSEGKICGQSEAKICGPKFGIQIYGVLTFDEFHVASFWHLADLSCHLAISLDTQAKKTRT